MRLLRPYLVLWMEASGLRFTEIGLAMSAYQALALVLDFPTGGLADKYARRVNFAFGTFLSRAGYVVIALSRTMAGFLTGFALAGTGAAFTSGSLTAWVYDATGDRRAAYQTFSKATIVEGLVGPVSAVLASPLFAAGLSLPITAAGIAALNASFTAVAFLEENYGKERERSYARVLSEGVAETLKNKPLLYLLASGCLMSFVTTLFMIYWVIVLRERGLPEAWLGTVYALLILSIALGGSYPAGYPGGRLQEGGAAVHLRLGCPLPRDFPHPLSSHGHDPFRGGGDRLRHPFRGDPYLRE